MSFTTPDLSTTYHERYAWGTNYLNALSDLKTNPKRYTALDVWEEHFDIMLSSGIRDERAMKARPTSSRYGATIALEFAKTDPYRLLCSHAMMCGDQPLSDHFHGVLVHRIVTHVLTCVDRDDFAALLYAGGADIW